jgi:hypothetical protein
VYRIEVRDFAMESIVDGLVATGRLSEQGATERATLEAAIAELISDFGRRWRR